MAERCRGGKQRDCTTDRLTLGGELCLQLCVEAQLGLGHENDGGGNLGECLMRLILRTIAPCSFMKRLKRWDP